MVSIRPAMAFIVTLNEVAKRQEGQLGTPVRQHPTVEKTTNMANMVGLILKTQLSID